MAGRVIPEKPAAPATLPWITVTVWGTIKCYFRRTLQAETTAAALLEVMATEGQALMDMGASEDREQTDRLSVMTRVLADGGPRPSHAPPDVPWGEPGIRLPAKRKPLHRQEELPI